MPLASRGLAQEKRCGVVVVGSAPGRQYARICQGLRLSLSFLTVGRAIFLSMCQNLEGQELWYGGGCHGVVGTYSWSWWCGVENEHAVNTILPYLGPSVANVSDGRSCIFCNVLHKWHWQREYAGMKGHETIEHTHMKRVLNRPDLSFLRLE